MVVSKALHEELDSVAAPLTQIQYIHVGGSFDSSVSRHTRVANGTDGFSLGAAFDCDFVLFGMA